MQSLYGDVPDSEETKTESGELKDVPDMEHSENVPISEKTNNAGSEDQKTTTNNWFYPTSFNATNNKIPTGQTTTDKGKYTRI